MSPRRPCSPRTARPPPSSRGKKPLIRSQAKGNDTCCRRRSYAALLPLDRSRWEIVYIHCGRAAIAAFFSARASTATACRLQRCAASLIRATSRIRQRTSKRCAFIRRCGTSSEGGAAPWAQRHARLLLRADRLGVQGKPIDPQALGAGLQQAAVHRNHDPREPRVATVAVPAWERATRGAMISTRGGRSP